MKFNDYNNKKNITGNLIRKHREQLDISRNTLSSKLSLLGITLYDNDIFHIENNKRTVRDFELIAICKILNIPLNDEFTDCL